MATGWGRSAAAALAVVLVLAGCAPRVDDPLPDPVEPDPTSAHAAYSLGHPGVVPTQFAAGPVDAAARMAFALDTETTAFRVHIRNWDYLLDTGVAGPLELLGVWLGPQRDDGAPAYRSAPTRIAAEGDLSDGATVTGPWISTDDVPIEPGVRQLLSIGIRGDGGTALAASPGPAWIDFDGAAALAGTADPLGDPSPGLGLLDVWIEYLVEPDVPTIVVIGHSLNTGGNVDAAASPHDGELTAWPRQWARLTGGAASSLAVAGSWTGHFLPESPKWATYDRVDPDDVVIWAASSDLAAGRTVGEVAISMQVLTDRVRATWPDARVWLLTEPPRGNPSDDDRRRTDWNAWLVAEGASALGATAIDVAPVLTSPSDPTRLRDAYSADGAHLNAAGHEVVAELVAASLDGS